MKLIVGLGNPGRKYEKTRHNLGFKVIDFIAERNKIDVDRESFRGLFGRGKIKGEDVILFKPQTYMNLSGQAVLEIVNYFKIETEDIFIIFDDMTLPVGKIRLRLSGSAGGHNGMADIIRLLHTNEIKRIRIGIGEPEFNSVDYVLSKPSKEEQKLLNEAIEAAGKAIEATFEQDFNYAMTKFN